MIAPSHPLHVAAVHTGALGALNRPLLHRQLTVSQQTNTPDINLERDVIPISAINTPEPDILLGMETGELQRERSNAQLQAQLQTLLKAQGLRVIPIGMEQTQSDEFDDDRFKVNISTILISALLFLLVLAWFDFIQSTFYAWLSPESLLESVPPAVKLWYAVLITIFILILVYLIYYYSRDYLK